MIGYGLGVGCGTGSAERGGDAGGAIAGEGKFGLSGCSRRNPGVSTTRDPTVIGLLVSGRCSAGPRRRDLMGRDRKAVAVGYTDGNRDAVFCGSSPHGAGL